MSTLHVMGGQKSKRSVLVLGLLLFIAPSAFAEDVEMNQKILVEVAPSLLAASRTNDQRPAELPISSKEFDRNRRIDLASLRVVRFDREKGLELSKPLPMRWYDDAIPLNLPECEQNVHNTDGIHFALTVRPHWGEFYNLQGDGLSGRLVWLHQQNGNDSAYYQISFRLLPNGKSPIEPPPRGFVGDVSPRCRATGASTTGMIHSRVCVADWNRDGLVDLIVGGATGKILVYLNRGTATEPLFSYARLLTDSEGLPIDVGWSAAPLIVDWDGDGLSDLLCGAEYNCVLFFKNEGSADKPRLVNHGFVTVDGERLTLPVKPVPNSPDGVFQRDYYPVLDVVDWNGDGKRDLLAAGYITGRVYFYESMGPNSDGTPKLCDRGPLKSLDKPLNVGHWAAAPCAVDFDNDGDLDLISGNMPISEIGGDSNDADHFLRYYENVGSKTEPQLIERDFPKSGRFPNAILGTPRASDFNGDGLTDLIVSAGENIFLYRNAGAKTQPLFEVHANPVPCTWGSVPLPTFGIQFVDWDGDTGLDLLSGLTIYRNLADGEFSAQSLLVSGEKIDHPAASGDGWIFTQLYDIDRDGDRDLLYGTHDGSIWWHRNDGKTPPRFEEMGSRLTLEDGQALHVGPRAGQAIDFDVLQGARTSLAMEDFDTDGLPDLVVGDTYGKCRYFRNLGPIDSPRFANPLELGDLKIRMVPFAADWDGDGRVDVIGSAASGNVVVWRNLGENRFGPADPLKFPAVPYSPTVAAVDWNQDGDLDLIVGTAYGFFCWFERSYLDYGYARAERVR